MKKFITPGLLSLLLILISSASIRLSAQPGPQPGKSSMKEGTAAMTLEEKVKLVVSNGFHTPGTQPQETITGQPQNKVPGAAGTTFTIPRLGIPSLVVSYGPAGLKNNKVLAPQVNINEIKKPDPGETGFIDELSNFSTIGR